MENRGMNKKGAGSSGIAFFVIAIIAAVVVVLAIVVFSGGFGQISGGIEQLGGDLGKRALTCQTFQIEDQTLWCDFSDVDKLEWANCDHPRIQSAFKVDKVESEYMGTCKGASVNSQIDNICEGLDESDRAKAKFNGDEAC